VASASDASGDSGQVRGDIIFRTKESAVDLDELLDLATPRVTARTTDLQEELQLLASRSEAAQRRRRPMRFALAGGVVAGVLGLGTVASAAGILPGWTLFTTGSGPTCEVAGARRPADTG
jgi:hypothetical protein